MSDDTPAAETGTPAPASASAATAPAASGRLDPEPGEWRRVSPTYIWVDLAGGLITAIMFTVAASLPWLFSRVTGLLAIPVAVVVIAVIALALTPRRVRAIGYRLREDDLLYRRGIMFQRFVAVPYGRMQLVDINRGPLARALGLSELKLVTAAAASNLTIPGLPAEDAEKLRDHLVDVAESRRVGL